MNQGRFKTMVVFCMTILFGTITVHSEPSRFQRPVASTKKIESLSFPILAGACRSSRRLHGPGKNGIDITVPGRDKGVRAPCEGRLRLLRDTYGYGNYAVVKCESGLQKDCEILLAHMQDRGLAQSGRVLKGEVIGYVGSTGYSSGPHMHVEVRCSGKPVTQRLASAYEKNFCGASTVSVTTPRRNKVSP